MKFSFEKKDNAFIISDNKQSFVVSGDDLPELRAMIGAMIEILSQDIMKEAL